MRNGKVDPGEEPIDGAVLVLDGGTRSEQVRRGAYRFDSIRSGDHVVSLLARVAAGRGGHHRRDRSARGVETQPALRRASTSRSSSRSVRRLARSSRRSRRSRPPPPAVRPSRPPTRPAPPRHRRQSVRSRRRSPALLRKRRQRRRDQPARRPRAAAVPADAIDSQSFAIQVAALIDPLAGASDGARPRAAGFPAYVVPPGPSDPDGPYRVRVGHYRTRQAASGAAATLQKLRGEKLWVISEPPTQSRAGTIYGCGENEADRHASKRRQPTRAG